ncbi:MAG: sigma-70 family RNA polymerase sigma factor [Myxococcota bacterium]
MLPEVLVREFLAARGAKSQDAVTPEALAALREVLRRAKQEEPSIELDPAAFIRYLAERSADADDLVDHLSKLRAGDLWLACGCTAGDKHALVRFQERFGPDIEMAIARSGNADISPEDFRQHLLGKLFAAPGDAPPRIAEYGGHGSLRGWLRITIVRQVIDFVRRTQRRDLGHQVDETELLELRAAASDPELAYVRSTFQAELREALSEGFASLTARERNLLRQFLIHSMGIDEVARIYGIHRATAHRWRLRAQGKLLENTRGALRRRLGADSREVDNAMMAMQSGLHITVRRYLSRDTEEEG